MVALEVQGIDRFTQSGPLHWRRWIKSLKTRTIIRQPFCRQREERLLLWLEDHPLVKSDARGDSGPPFAETYQLPIPKHAPLATRLRTSPITICPMRWGF